jgi:hypothetical protein
MWVIPKYPQCENPDMAKDENKLIVRFRALLVAFNQVCI